MNEEFLTVADVADWLKCNEVSVRKLMLTNQLTHVKGPGRKKLTTRQWVLDYLSGVTIQAEPVRAGE